LSKKRKLLFRISIALNILLIVIVVWGYTKISFANEQLFIVNVQQNLVELEGLITNQSNNGWSEPNLVTAKLGDVLSGIRLSLTYGEQLKALSDGDMEILNKLHYKLNQYPNDTLYSFVDLTQEDKEKFEELGDLLRDAGLGLNMSVSGDMKSFMKQVEKLEKNIDAPLN